MTQSKAMLAALAAFFVWVLFDVVMKLAGQQQISPFLILGVFGLTGIAGLVVSAAYQKEMVALRPKNIRASCMVAACSVVCNLANIVTLKHLPLTIFYIVVFTAPLLMAVVVSFLKHEVLTKTKIACLVLGFAGVVTAIIPRIAAGGEWIGYAAGMVSVTAFVIFSITINRISKTESARSIQMVTAISLALCSLPGALSVVLPDDKMLFLLVVAGFGNLIANLLYNKALQYTSATNVAQLHYTQIIWGAAMGYLLWHEMPTVNLVAGSVLIILSGIFVTRQVRRFEAHL